MAYQTQTGLAGPSILDRVANVRNLLADKWIAYQTYRSTFNELSSLTDRDLNDLGISRADIGRISREAAETK